MRKLLMLPVLLGLMLVCSSNDLSADGKKGGDAKANDGVITNWGQPSGFGPGKATAYWIWHEDGIWHLRTTGGGKGTHRFDGKVEVVGGQLVGLKGKKGEYSGKNADRFIFGPGGIVFDFKTDEGVDGLNFAVDSGATAIKFTLAIDGEAAPKHIRIGKQGDHPSAAVFEVPAHPTDTKAKNKSKK